MRRLTSYKSLALTATMLCMALSVMAGSPPPPPPPPMGIPIDAGASVMLLIAGIMGGYRLYNKKNNQQA